MLQTCLSEHAVQIANISAESSSKSTSQNSVTCLYQIHLGGCRRSLSITWPKNTIDPQGFFIEMDQSLPQHACVVANVDRRPVRKMQAGCKSFHHEGHEIQVFWDLSSAKYTSGSEPKEHFYIVISCKADVLLFLGDMLKDACKRINAKSMNTETKLLSRSEHLHGRKHFATKAQLGVAGVSHAIVIECHGHTYNRESKLQPYLSIRVDQKILVKVDQLEWKFRGNQTILVDGVAMEVLWDVHNWLFSPSIGHAVFIFHTLSSMNHKHWPKDLNTDSCNSICTGVCDTSTICKDPEMEDPFSPLGFSLCLYAWKCDQ